MYDRLHLRKEYWFVCALWLSVHMKSVVAQGFSMNLHSTTKCLKHSLNFESGENVQSSNNIEFEFELRHIPVHNLSNAYKPTNKSTEAKT